MSGNMTIAIPILDSAAAGTIRGGAVAPYAGKITKCSLWVGTITNTGSGDSAFQLTKGSVGDETDMLTSETVDGTNDNVLYECDPLITSAAHVTEGQQLNAVFTAPGDSVSMENCVAYVTIERPLGPT